MNFKRLSTLFLLILAVPAWAYVYMGSGGANYYYNNAGRLPAPPVAADISYTTTHMLPPIYLMPSPGYYPMHYSYYPVKTFPALPGVSAPLPLYYMAPNEPLTGN